MATKKPTKQAKTVPVAKVEEIAEQAAAESAENKEQALDNAMARENVIGTSEYEQENWEVIDDYEEEIDITEIEYEQDEGV